MNADQLDALLHGGLLLVGLACLERALEASRAGNARRARVAFGAVMLAGLAAYPGWDRLQGKRLLHGPELVHYVLGSKYFPELGYAELYDAIAYASFDARLGLPIDVRNLRTGVLEGGADAFPRGEAISSEFWGSRFHEFEQDLRLFHRLAPSAHVAAVQDHGFNATPPWIAVARAIQRDRPLTEARLYGYAALDVGLLAVALIALGATFGLRRTAVAVLCFGTAYTFRFAWNGGSFLRFDWLAALALALVCLRRDRYLLAGGFLAYAACMRLFPAFFALAAGAPLLMAARDGLARRRLAALVLGFALAAGGLAALGGHAGRGYGAYREFAERIGTHGSAWASNHVGLDTAGIVDAIVLAQLDANRREVDFEEFRRPIERARSVRRPIFFAGLLAAIAATFAASRRLRAYQAMPLGAFLVFAASTISGYYWAMTLVVPFVAPLRTSYGLMAASLLACIVEGLAGELTAAHVVVSFVYLALFVDWVVQVLRGASLEGPLDEAAVA